MILNKGECVLFENPGDFIKAWKLLHDEGYRMWGGTRIGGYLPQSKSGFHWCMGYDYPSCIATMDAQMARHARLHGVVDDGDLRDTPYAVVELAEFFRRAYQGQPTVDDLL